MTQSLPTETSTGGTKLPSPSGPTPNSHYGGKPAVPFSKPQTDHIYQAIHKRLEEMLNGTAPNNAYAQVYISAPPVKMISMSVKSDKRCAMLFHVESLAITPARPVPQFRDWPEAKRTTCGRSVLGTGCTYFFEGSPANMLEVLEQVLHACDSGSTEFCFKAFCESNEGRLDSCQTCLKQLVCLASSTSP